MPIDFSDIFSDRLDIGIRVNDRLAGKRIIQHPLDTVRPLIYFHTRGAGDYVEVRDKRREHGIEREFGVLERPPPGFDQITQDRRVFRGKDGDLPLFFLFFGKPHSDQVIEYLVREPALEARFPRKRTGRLRPMREKRFIYLRLCGGQDRFGE